MKFRRSGTLKANNQVTTIFKIRDIKTRLLCLRMAKIVFPRTLISKLSGGGCHRSPSFKNLDPRQASDLVLR